MVCSKTNIQSIDKYMRSCREKKHWSKKDIEIILSAIETDNWTNVKLSKLYNVYGAEYCSLLEAINLLLESINLQCMYKEIL